MRIVLLLFVSLMLSGVIAAHAQNTGNNTAVFADGLLRTSATVLGWDGNKLRLKSVDGNVTINLPAEVIITKRLAGTLADVKPGMFLGSAAVLGTDGKLHAKEIHLIPDALRGGTGGHRAMDEANTSMTNGSVSTLTAGNATITQGGANGMVMSVSYPGGAQQIQVAGDVPVTIVTQVKREVLQVGDPVNITAKRNTDDSIVVQRIDIMATSPK